ncbi:MAG: ABC transporter permease [Candidatus Zixiibacteriota bacterium]
MLPLLSIKQFLQDLRNQKLRTFMTMFGILWGTVSIILLMAFGTGMSEYHMRKARGLGENIAIIWPGITSEPWKGLPRGRRIPFTSEDVARIKESNPLVEIISPEFPAGNVMLKSQRNNMRARVVGVWPEFHEMRNIFPQAGGRFINDKDLSDKRRVVFIGDELAEKLYPGEDPVGQTMQIRGTPFVIVGVMQSKEQNSSYGERDRRIAYVPSTTFHTMFSRQYPENMVLKAIDDNSIQGAIDGVYRYLAAKYNFNPDDTEALSVWDVTEGFKFLNTFFLAFRLFLVGTGCLTLITGGIGVTNIMNVVLEERTKEIGIKMALGAKKRTIMSQFIFETVLLTGLGGAIGFGIAYGIVTAFSFLDQNSDVIKNLGIPTMHTVENIAAVCILGLIAFLAGFFPARRAANLEPVKALKLF